MWKIQIPFLKLMLIDEILDWVDLVEKYILKYLNHQTTPVKTSKASYNLCMPRMSKDRLFIKYLNINYKNKGVTIMA